MEDLLADGLPTRRAVTARSFEEALAEVQGGACTGLDFTYHVSLSARSVKDLQARLSDVQGIGGAESVDDLTMHLNHLQARAIALFEAIKSNNFLECLRVDGKDIGEAALSALAASLETNRSLLILELSANHATFVSMKMLGMSLKWHCLQELHLDFNYMGNAAVDVLCEGLQGNCALKRLGLRGNNIGPEFPQSVLWLLTPRPVSSSDVVYKGTELFESSLRTVHFDFNNIKDLPIRLGNIVKLELSVTQNPIHHPPPDVVASGWRHTWKVLHEEWRVFEAWHEEQTRLHNLALQQNSTLPKWMPGRDYAGVNADDL